MNKQAKISLQPSVKVKPRADIAFCIDSTGSMQPCIVSIKNGLSNFVQGLHSAADVDFHLRLIAYRDLHDPTAREDQPWHIGAFTSSVDTFQRELEAITANGGGEHRGAESTLDALYIAIHSEWRVDAHKAIVLLTDDNTHTTLHPSTYKRPDNDIGRIIQDFQTLRSVILFMIAPRYPAYQEIERAMDYAERKVLAYYVSQDDERYVGLKNVDWRSLLKILGETISRTSVAAESLKQ